MADETLDPTIRGKITLVITEKEDGNWYSELVPDILCTEQRDIIKLALICASVQDHMAKNLGFMDTIIKTKEVLREIQDELTEERGGKNRTHKAWHKPTVDIDKYQTKLPFEEDEDAQRQAEMDDWADNGFDDGLGDTDDS